jgi:outer membrane protein assembly factor BamB
VSRALPAALLASAALGGCFQELEGRVVLGSQGYTPRSTLFLQRWSRQVTWNEPWDYKPLEYASAAISDNGERVFIGSRGGTLWCFEVRTGKVVWRVRLGREIRSALTFHEGVLYFGAADGHFYSVDAEEGKVRWKYATKGEILSRPVITSDRVYFTTGDHTLYAVDADTGEWRWHYSRPVPEGFSIQGHAGPLLHKGSLYVGFADGFLVALKSQDGALLWEKKLSEAPRFGDVDTTPVLAGGAILAGSFAEGLFALDPEDGIIRWKIPASGASTPAVVGDTGYFTTPGGEVIAFRVADGKVLWRSRIDPGFVSEPAVYGRYLLVSQSQIGTAQTRGGVWALDRDTGAVEAIVDVGHGVRGRPAVGHGHLYFVTDSGWFYAYRFGRGSSRP